MSDFTSLLIETLQWLQRPADAAAFVAGGLLSVLRFRLEALTLLTYSGQPRRRQSQRTPKSAPAA